MKDLKNLIEIKNGKIPKGIERIETCDKKDKIIVATKKYIFIKEKNKIFRFEHEYPDCIVTVKQIMSRIFYLNSGKLEELL